MAKLSQDRMSSDRRNAFTFQKRFYSRTSWPKPAEVNCDAHFLEAMKVLEKLDPGYFLDVGCATSPIGKYLKNMGGRPGWICYGLDISEAIIIAQQNGVNACICDLGVRWPVVSQMVPYMVNPLYHNCFFFDQT